MTHQKPSCNLTVIRVSNLDKALLFYEQLGLLFEQHKHGSGPTHYAATVGPHTFELYPLLANIFSRHKRLQTYKLYCSIYVTHFIGVF